MNKKIAIISCFETYGKRLELVCNFFKSKGLDVTVYHSNFKHFDKTENLTLSNDFNIIKVIPYKKNLSFSRLYSHYQFSKDVYRTLENEKIDYIYSIIPPNYLVYFLNKLKKKTNVRLFYDVMDIWPETMPIKKIEKFPPIKYWKDRRDKYLNNADVVVLECNLFKNYINLPKPPSLVKTVYLAKESNNLALPKKSNSDIKLAYLGSINNIIDTEYIVNLLTKISSKFNVSLEIIGGGEQTDILLEKLKNRNLVYNYHGIVYDKDALNHILSQCDFGLNVMKKSVRVGLTMKSIDYLYYGLPLINNIKGDTEDLINNCGFGINIFDIDSINVQNMFSIDNCNILRSNVYECYKHYFSIDAFNRKFEEIFQEFIESKHEGVINE